jgi:TM2 domain-containing membrane protein YozV
MFGLSQEQKSVQLKNLCPFCRKFPIIPIYAKPDGKHVPALTPLPAMDRSTVARCPKCDNWWYVFEEGKKAAIEQGIVIPEPPEPKKFDPTTLPDDASNWVIPSEPPKSAAVATILSVIFAGGGGQIYLGQTTKGILIIVVSLLLACLGIGFITWAIGIVDAYFIAQKLSTGNPVKKMQFF